MGLRTDDYLYNLSTLCELLFIPVWSLGAMFAVKLSCFFFCFKKRSSQIACLKLVDDGMPFGFFFYRVVYTVHNMRVHVFHVKLCKIILVFRGRCASVIYILVFFSHLISSIPRLKKLLENLMGGMPNH